MAFAHWHTFDNKFIKREREGEKKLFLSVTRVSVNPITDRGSILTLINPIFSEWISVRPELTMMYHTRV